MNSPKNKDDLATGLLPRWIWLLAALVTWPVWYPYAKMWVLLWVV